MSVKIKIDPDATEEEVEEINRHSEHVQISLHARKTLDGKIMILDHKLIDIILDTEKQKIITFPKEELTDEIYSIQSSYFKYMVNEGVVLPGSIRSGNIFGSLEGVYPDAAEKGVSSTQVVIYSTKKFIDAQAPHLEVQDFIENEMDDHLVDPTAQDSTELGEVPEEPKKGSITPSRIRRYLSGYGYY